MPIQTQFNPLTGELDVKQLPDAADYDIAYTRAMRRRLIGALTNDGTVFPTDAESIEALSKLLADKDRQALSLKKLKLEEQNAGDNGEAAKFIAQILSQINGKSVASTEVYDRDPVELPTDAPLPEIVPGMLDNNQVQQTYASFQAKRQAKQENVDPDSQK